MANPITFRPPEFDPKQGLMKRLEAAPKEHAEALLVAYDLLQEAHDQGILDALHGMVHAKDAIVGHIAEGASVPASVDALRNLISAGKILGTIDPEVLSHLASTVGSAIRKPAAEPPSLWALFRRATSREGRRGLDLVTNLLIAMGTRT